jgi:hypothetical protein
MSICDGFPAALQAYQEALQELHPEQHPPLGDGPAEKQGGTAAGFPDGSLLIGMDEDGMPLLLNLLDPSAGSILVAGDTGAGKTLLLQSLAAASNGSDPGEIQFAVLTPYPEEWQGFEALPNCLGIWFSRCAAADELLGRLVHWKETLGKTRQAVLLLVDGVRTTDLSNQAYHNLDLLISLGPRHNLWTILAINPACQPHLESLLDQFQTRIIGCIQRPLTAALLVDAHEVDPSHLIPGKQFGLAWPQGWLRFRLPA